MSVDTESWIERLAAKLYMREAQFRAARAPSRNYDADASELDRPNISEHDDEGQRKDALVAATFALLEITEALSELPVFAGRVGLMPLDELITSLGDLPRGGHPRMLKPFPKLAKGQDSFQKSYIKKQAVAGVLCLIKTGMTEKAACEIVARQFRDAGVTNRKKVEGMVVGLTAGSVLEWVSAASSDTVTGRQARAFIEEWRTESEATFTSPNVIAWITDMVQRPAFQARI